MKDEQKRRQEEEDRGITSSNPTSEQVRFSFSTICGEVYQLKFRCFYPKNAADEGRDSGSPEMVVATYEAGSNIDVDDV